MFFPPNRHKGGCKLKFSVDIFLCLKTVSFSPGLLASVCLTSVKSLEKSNYPKYPEQPRQRGIHMKKKLLSQRCPRRLESQAPGRECEVEKYLSDNKIWRSMRYKFPRLDGLLGRMAKQASWEGGRAGNRAWFAVSIFTLLTAHFSHLEVELLVLRHEKWPESLQVLFQSSGTGVGSHWQQRRASVAPSRQHLDYSLFTHLPGSAVPWHFFCELNLECSDFSQGSCSSL